MTSDPNAHKAARSAARALVEQLVVNGVDHVFTVPGESFLPVLDALADSGITVTVCRQEGGAAMMADACERMRSTSSEPCSTISWKARLNRKSPTSTLDLLPHTSLAVALPRLKWLSSTTSS